MSNNAYVKAHGSIPSKHLGELNHDGTSRNVMFILPLDRHRATARLFANCGQSISCE